MWYYAVSLSEDNLEGFFVLLGGNRIWIWSSVLLLPFTSFEYLNLAYNQFCEDCQNEYIPLEYINLCWWQGFPSICLPVFGVFLGFFVNCSGITESNLPFLIFLKGRNSYWSLSFHGREWQNFSDTPDFCMF